ncbi:MAG TPA: hypothetical protein VJS39_13445, partial [Gemmatimonadaceae bacterium]|nr:hypothetical protein [Gemmatimonadaceae bacterium]
AVEIGTAAREALRDDEVEVSRHVPEMVWNVALDKRQAALDARENVRAVDIGTGVLYDDGDT